MNKNADIYNQIKRDIQWDVYAKEYTEHLMDNDAISPKEAGFIHGYNDAVEFNEEF